jgi:dTMP kinase
MSGKLIVLEGIDGAGTTTQTERLAARYGAEVVAATREPSELPIGKLIRQLLRHELEPVDATAMALLFAADRMDHVRRLIEPLLQAGRHVVSDRYLLSSLAYQSLTVDVEFVEAVNQRARTPDLTVFIDVPVEVAEARRLARGGQLELFDHRDTQLKVAAAYRRQAERRRADRSLVVVDGSLDAERVFAAVLAAVESCIGPPPLPSSV